MTLLIAVGPVLLAWGIFAAIWHFARNTRPIMAGSLILIIGLVATAIYLKYFEGFFVLGIGFIVLIPALIVVAISVFYFIMAIRRGQAGAFAGLQTAKSVLKDVYNGSHH